MNLLSKSVMETATGHLQNDDSVRKAGDKHRSVLADLKRRVEDWRGGWADGTLKATLNDYYDLLAKSPVYEHAERTAWARQIDPTLTERGEEIVTRSAEFSAERSRLLDDAAKTLKSLLTAIGAHCGRVSAQILQSEALVAPWEVRDHAYRIASSYLEAQGESVRLRPGGAMDGPFSESYFAEVAKAMGLDPKKDHRSVHARMAQPAYLYVLTDSKRAEHISDLQNDGLTLIETASCGNRWLLAIKAEEDPEHRVHRDHASKWGLSFLRSRPDACTLHGPYAVDPTLRHDVVANMLPQSLVEAVGNDLSSASDKVVQGLQATILHGRWPTDRPDAASRARFEQFTAEVGNQVAARKLDTFSTLFEGLAAPRLMPAPEAARPTHSFAPEYGAITAEDDKTLVYTVDLTHCQPDAVDVIDVLRFAHTCIADWDNGSGERSEDVEEIVARCVSVLNIDDAIEEYRRYLAAGQVAGIDLSRTEHDSDTPIGVCQYFVSARYALGDRTDWGMISDVSQCVRSMAQELCLEAPAPAPRR